MWAFVMGCLGMCRVSIGFGLGLEIRDDMGRYGSKVRVGGSGLSVSWVIQNDLTRPHPKWWFISRTVPKWP